MNRKEWLEWRKQGIGASDAPAILGISPYMTPFQLWEEKTGKVSIEREGNDFVLNKGNQYEPFARAKYELINDMEMPPIRCQHKDIPFLLATMDGGNEEFSKGIEIKYVGKDVHENTKKTGNIPAHHYAQIQHQFIVTGFKSIDYLSYYVASGNDEHGNKIKPEPKNGDLFVKEILPDELWIDEYIGKAFCFWDCVKKDNPPELTDKDIRVIKGHDDLAKKYIEAKKILDQASKDVDSISEEIKKISEGIARAQFSETGLTVIKSYRVGNVDYSKIEVLKGINLEKYRKKSSSYYKLTIKKD